MNGHSMRVRPFLLSGLWLALAVSVSLVCWKFQTRLRMVDPGVVYRSAQLDKSDLQKTLARLSIRSVVNLQGANPSKAWYQDETAVCQAAGIRHYDISLNAKHLPSPEDVRRILDIFKTAPKPLLLHCRSGADRSGLVSALYLSTQKGVPVAEAARRELNWTFGHIPFLGYEEMDELFSLYLDSKTPRSLEQWLQTDYIAVYRDECIENGWMH